MSSMKATPALGTQSGKAFFLRQRFHRDVMFGFFSLLFQLVNLHIQMLDLFLKFSLPPLLSLHCVFR